MEHVDDGHTRIPGPAELLGDEAGKPIVTVYEIVGNVLRFGESENAGDKFIKIIANFPYGNRALGTGRNVDDAGILAKIVLNPRLTIVLGSRKHVN
jgi:hypothetical protein